MRRHHWLWGLSAALALTGAAFLAEGPARAAGKARTAEEIAKICSEAEQRYQQLHGKASSEEPGVAVVLMYKYTFCPVHLTVAQGAKVRWVNVDKRTSHSTWFKSAGKPESDRLFPEEQTEMRFDLPPGDYPYLCGPHWESDGMMGTVTVTP
jgi:plastocyanin